MGPRASQDLRSPSPIMAPDPIVNLDPGWRLHLLQYDDVRVLKLLPSGKPFRFGGMENFVKTFYWIKVKYFTAFLKTQHIGRHWTI